MKNAALTLATSIFALSTVFATADDREIPDPSCWAFLEGDWAVTTPEGKKAEFTCRLNDAKTCYLLTSANFQGTLGVDSSSDHPMLILGYHPGAGYSVGHWKRESDTKISGGFWIVNKQGKKTAHTSVFEKTDDGVSYTIDKDQVYLWRKR